MSADATGLDTLHDILVPAPAPWWPPAPGWYWVLGLAAVIGTVLLWRAAARAQRNRYRREALAQLAQIEARIEARTDAPDAALAAMAVLLKRTALTGYAREQVASLTGAAWFAFLDHTGGTRFSDELGAALARASYQTEGTAEVRAADIAAEVRRWIVQHGACDPTPETQPTAGPITGPMTGPTTPPAQTAPRKKSGGKTTEAA
jgi:hypothetical protein